MKIKDNCQFASRDAVDIEEWVKDRLTMGPNYDTGELETMSHNIDAIARGFGRLLNHMAENGLPAPDLASIVGAFKPENFTYE